MDYSLGWSIAWVSLCMMQFWLTYQCSSFDVWQQKQGGHSQFLCNKIFFRWFFRHFQFCIAIPISQFSFHSPAGFVHISTLSFLYQWTLHFQSFLFSVTHSVFTPADMTGWGIFLTNFFSLFGVLVFKQHFYVCGEKYYTCPTLKFFSSELMPLNCSTSILKPGIRNWKSDSNTYLNCFFSLSNFK